MLVIYWKYISNELKHHFKVFIKIRTKPNDNSAYNYHHNLCSLTKIRFLLNNPCSSDHITINYSRLIFENDTFSSFWTDMIFLNFSPSHYIAGWFVTIWGVGSSQGIYLYTFLYKLYLGWFGSLTNQPLPPYWRTIPIHNFIHSALI